MRRLAPALIAALALAGCTTPDGRYPSLLPRPIESLSMAEPVRPAPVAAPDPALDAGIAEIGAALARSAADFTRDAQSAEAQVAVAAGTERGSEPWVEAQGALARLDSARAASLGALADLERLAVDRGVAGQPPYPALDAAVEAARTQAQAQAERIAMLEAALAGG